MAGEEKYNGEWSKGVRHGVGTCNYADGAVYEGEWFSDKPHGFGVYDYVTRTPFSLTQTHSHIHHTPTNPTQPSPFSLTHSHVHHTQPNPNPPALNILVRGKLVYNTRANLPTSAPCTTPHTDHRTHAQTQPPSTTNHSYTTTTRTTHTHHSTPH